MERSFVSHDFDFPTDSPHMIVFAGVNGAGKSNLTRILSDELQRYRIIDADAIARNIDPENPEKVNLRAGKEALRQVDEAIASKMNFTFETTLSGSNALRLMQRARESGYHVTLFYIGLERPGLYIDRVMQRVREGGHFISAELINQRYVTSFDNLPKAMKLANSVILLDNTDFYKPQVIIKDSFIVFRPDRLSEWAAGVLHSWNPEHQTTLEAQSRYCYPGTDVLINLLNIRDQFTLGRYEDAVTSLRIAELVNMGVSGKFDFRHLQDIHRHIFQDIYPFAGQIRQEDIQKGFHFARYQFIESEGVRLLSELAAENHLKGLDADAFSRRAAHYMAELNVLHPFREGNGRTIREFIRQLGLNAGHVVDFNRVPRQIIFDASVRSVVDPQPLAKVIRECIREVLPPRMR